MARSLATRRRFSSNGFIAGCILSAGVGTLDSGMASRNFRLPQVLASAARESAARQSDWPIPGSSIDGRICARLGCAFLADAPCICQVQRIPADGQHNTCDYIHRCAAGASGIRSCGAPPRNHLDRGIMARLRCQAAFPRNPGGHNLGRVLAMDNCSRHNRTASFRFESTIYACHPHDSDPYRCLDSFRRICPPRAHDVV